MVVSKVGSGEQAEARALWTGLERSLGGAPAMSCSWAWTETWLEHYGDAVPHSFVVGELAGNSSPVAIALVTRAPERALRPREWQVGTAGEPRGSGVFVERNRLLCLPDTRAAFAAALVGQLRADSGWDRLLFDGMHADDAADILSVLGGAGPDVAATVEQCPITDLQEGDDVLAALSGSRRQRIRRTLRAFGDLELDWAADAAQADAILTELIDLHQQRWTESGAPGAFSSPRFTSFHRALIAQLVPEGKAALVRVRRGDEIVGCLYGLIDGDRMCFYQGGLKRYEDNRLRSGVAAHVTFMQACRERGLDSYDFLAPSARYKEELASRAEPLTWLTVRQSPPGYRLRLAALARAVRVRR
jgi:CelD/BcsL family acetyltransferase involved in cellulose biosynthesis